MRSPSKTRGFPLSAFGYPIAIAWLALEISTCGQGTTTPRPFFSQPAATAVPRDVKLVEKPFAELSDQEPRDKGKLALGIAPEKWKHAETENFILHFRRVTEAQKVAREVEYNLWFVATQLGATKDRYSRKSHVFVFEDDDEWKKFKGLLGPNGIAWAASFAVGDELFLNVRGSNGGGFESQTLAHETTHAVVARLFRGRRWPLWLNEGFAEYMGGTSVAARKGQSAKRYQRALDSAEMPLASVESMTSYPDDPAAISQLYQTSEKFVRFLMNEFPKDRFVKFIDATLDGKGMQEAVLEIYADKVKDWDSFMRRYERFTK
jgi:hypothetical protein